VLDCDLVASFRRGFLLFVGVFFLSGCSTLGYYLDLVNGHAAIINQAEPIVDVLAQQGVRPEVKKALLQMQAARQFAVQQLLLPDNNSYRSYADIGRQYVVWNVVATDEFSVKPQQWCYWIVGCMSYRGYYNEQDAETFGATLRKKHQDVLVSGVSAYSTLGWFEDPVLNTMLYRNEAMRLNLIFHELSHQKVYAKSDSAFNEAFATAVAEEGVRRWYQQQQKPQQFKAYQHVQQYRQAFNQLLKRARDDLAILYRQPLSVEVMRQRKYQRFEQLKREYKELKTEWQGDQRYDSWMQQDLNNAHLAIVATYHDAVPGFRALLKKHHGDLSAFYQAVNAMVELTPEQRHLQLHQLASANNPLMTN